MMDKVTNLIKVISETSGPFLARIDLSNTTKRNLKFALGFVTLFVIYNTYRHRPNAIPPPASNGYLLDLSKTVAPRGYRILALGGTITGGETLDHHSHSYPYLLGSPSRKVAFAEVFPTEDDYPGLCVDDRLDKTKVDVVLLEVNFSETEQDIEVTIKGIETLVRSLRSRFPDAIIIYIHIYSLRLDAVDNDGHPASENGNKPSLNVNYHWGPGEKISNNIHRDIDRIMAAYGGETYTLPRTPQVIDSVFLFASDWEHLSQEGHNEVAEGIMYMLKVREKPKKWPKFGKWDDELECDED